MYDPAEFKDGAAVRIAPKAELEVFLATWTLHHKLEKAQLDFAGTTARVKSSGMYHGGDVLYQLEGVPGTWHEHLLHPA